MSEGWKERMVERLASGKAPTVDELEDALQGALEERQALVEEVADLREARNILQRAVMDLSGWLNRLAMAYCKNDGAKSEDIMLEFVQSRVNALQGDRT